MQNKKILYIDMDNVLVDFPSAFKHLDNSTKEKFKNNMDDVPNIFSKMEPIEGAIDAYNKLCKKYDTYVLSTAPWNNPSSWSDKLEWVKKYLGEKSKKKLILSHHKHLNMGDFLIDDRPNNGAKNFKGEWLHFGKDGQYKSWQDIINYLL